MCQLDWTLGTQTFGWTLFWVCLWWPRGASIFFSSHERRPPSEPFSELAVLLKWEIWETRDCWLASLMAKWKGFDARIRLNCPLVFCWGQRMFISCGLRGRLSGDNRPDIQIFLILFKDAAWKNDGASVFISYVICFYKHEGMRDEHLPRGKWIAYTWGWSQGSQKSSQGPHQLYAPAWLWALRVIFM